MAEQAKASGGECLAHSEKRLLQMYEGVIKSCGVLNNGLLTFNQGVGSKGSNYYIGTTVWSSVIPSDVRKTSGIAKILDRFDESEVDRVIAFEDKHH